MRRSWSGGLPAIAASLTAALALTACTRSDEVIDPGPTTLSIAPAIAASAAGGITTFGAAGGGSGTPSVSWRVNGIPGGSAEVGLISAAGVYTAPAVIPDGDSVVVSAVLDGDPTQEASSSVFFLPERGTAGYYVALPRVVDVTHPVPIRFLVVPSPGVAGVRFLPSAGPAVALAPIGAGAFTFTLDPAQATAGYLVGALHNQVGRLEYRTATGDLTLANLGVNVRDAGAADVPITALAADAQRGPHLLNLRVDGLADVSSEAVATRAIELLGDRFDFLILVSNVSANRNRFYTPARNDVSGIGASVFDQSALWGSAGRLHGVITFPLDDFFDGAEAGTIHEIGHAWINFAIDQILGAGLPHWPLSTMANGVMGFSIPGSGAGGEFPWSLTPLGDGTVRVHSAPPSDHYTPLDLYVMGLLPPDSVPPVQVLPPETDQGSLREGLILPATTYTTADYVAAMGPRVPSSGDAQRDFTAVCVVLSYGRLLAFSETAFFDHVCARAETRTPLFSTIGLVTKTASGFYLATGGRATLTTRLP